jgi:cytochrome c peroxidase
MKQEYFARTLFAGLIVALICIFITPHGITAEKDKMSKKPAVRSSSQVATPAPKGTEPVPSSYMAVRITEPFKTMAKRVKAEKSKVMKEQMELLNKRYDLSDNPAEGVVMSGGKAVQAGVRVKLPEGVTWEELGKMKPEQIKEKGLWPAGFYPLPHMKQEIGGQVFPKFHIDEIQKQESRDLTRIDVDFDLPDRFLPEFPPPVYLVTRPDLGDVSQGKLITIKNYYELFNGILNPKQLEGLRLLVTPFPQQQFNATADRLVEKPSLGVTCFDCHANGHTNAATHLAPDIRPNASRHRVDTPTLRGVNVQRLFGSQRSLMSVEDFTEFEQRTAYFDGDIVIATKKGVNILERATQVDFMAAFQKLMDFPPAPKLNVYGRLDPEKASETEMKGQDLFFGKAKCAVCHPSPYYTDNMAHDLKTERFYKTKTINGRVAAGDGMIKTFPLRGIKDSPPYMHDGRCLTLEDTVELFNLVQGLQLTAEEKKQLVAFLRVL